MSSPPPDADARAAVRRATWQGRLSMEHPAVLAGETTAAQRLELMEELSLFAWTLSGQPLPAYTRANMPTRLVKPGER